MKLYDEFKALFKSSPFGELLKTGIELKRADKATSKKMSILSAVSCIGMTVLGFFAMGFLGALIFFVIIYSASFFLNFSMKKKVLLAYLKFYREKLPSQLCAGVEKVEKPRIPSTLNSLYPDTLNHWTLCYGIDRIDTGFVRIIQGSREISSGMAAITACEDFKGALYKGYFPSLSDEYAEQLTCVGSPSTNALEFAKLLDGTFDSFAMVFGEDFSLLYSPSAQDFMTDRVENPDGLKPEAVARQVAYFNIAKSFEALDTELLSDALSLFGCDVSEENQIYKQYEDKK